MRVAGQRLANQNNWFKTKIANNDAGMDSEDFVLDVGSEAEILSDQNHVMPEIGLSVVLECPATGNPQPKVEWFRDNAIITDSKRYEVILRSSEVDFRLDLKVDDLSSPEN